MSQKTSQKESKTFLYKKVYQDLKDRIQNGEYLRDALLPSEREIGETYQVDRTTVRKALQLLVDDGLVEKRAGKGTVVVWRPDQEQTQSRPVLRPERRNGPIAFLLPRGDNNSSRITQPFYSQLFYRAEKECQKLGYTLVYSTLDETDHFDELVQANGFSGIFFVSNVSHRHLDQALELRIPSILINSYYERMPSILSDNFSGTYTACRYLIERGHKSIGIINGNSRYTTNNERWRGCVTALREAGLSLKNEFCLGGTSWEFEAGLAAVEQMLAKNTVYPTALVAFNDRLALGAIQAIHQAGLRVPDDISVIGYDNSDQAKYSMPKITTVEIHAPLMAQTASRLLFQQIDDYEVLTVKVLTPVELIEQDSVRPLE